MFCPVCKGEFREGFTHCDSCNVNLVEDLNNITEKVDGEFKVIFVSGDGASGIKNYTNCFPNAKFVLDPFHYIRKHLRYIFKRNTELKDEYLENEKKTYKLEDDNWKLVKKTKTIGTIKKY